MFNNEDKQVEQVTEGLNKVVDEVKKLGKPQELSTLEKQLNSFLGTELDVKVAQAKEKFVNLSVREREAFKQSNPELYNKIFPELEAKKPEGYDNWKKLIEQNENDVKKLPYNVRLYAKEHDKEFDNIITVATMTIEALQSNRPKNKALEAYNNYKRQG